jgi:polyisoprenoid-binding protein YceI
MTDTLATDLSTLPGLVPGTWTIDPAHSTVGFAVRHLMSKVRGRFTEFGGQIVTTPDLTQCSVTATIDLSSVSTGNEMRDNHLRSADFFNVEQSPTMTFTSDGLCLHEGRWIVGGDLTIRGVTKHLEIELEYLGSDPTGLQGEARIGFEGTTSIRRQDFGVSFGLAVDASKVIIGDKVDIVLEVEAFLNP